MLRSLGDILLKSLRFVPSRLGLELCERVALAPDGLDPNEWLRKFAAAFRWERSSLFCRLGEGDDLILVAQSGSPPLKRVWPRSHPFLAWLAQTRHPLSLARATRDERLGSVREAALKYFVEVGASLCVPLYWQGFVGLLNVDPGRRHSRRWQGELHWIRLALSALAGHQKTVSERERLHHELSLWDCTRRQFLSRMTDELKTPLNSIIGLADALASGLDGTLTEEQVGHLAMIRTSGEELLHLVNRLLDLGTMESETPTFQVRKVNLERLLKELIADLEFQNGPARWHINVETGLPGIYIDEEKIGRVLATLFGTAKEGDGETHVVRARRKGDMVEMTIEGASIGLSLDMVVVQKIIAMHGGSLIPAHTEQGYPSLKLTLPARPIGLERGVSVVPVRKSA